MTEQERMLALMESLDEMREGVNAFVQALKADGFTDSQARWIVVGIFTQQIKDQPANEEDQP